MRSPAEAAAGAVCLPGEELVDLKLRGLRLLQNPRFFCFSGDAARLAEFAAAACPKAQNICELGSGNGGLLLALWARLPAAACTGLEVLPSNAELAERTLALNRGVPGLAEHCRFVCGDWRQYGRYFAEGEFDLIVSNPPFWPCGDGRLSPVLERRAATHEVFGGLADMLRAAAALLCPGGQICLLLAAERADTAQSLLQQLGISLQERQYFARRVIIRAQKG